MIAVIRAIASAGVSVPQGRQHGVRFIRHTLSSVGRIMTPFHSHQKLIDMNTVLEFVSYARKRTSLRLKTLCLAVVLKITDLVLRHGPGIMTNVMYHAIRSRYENIVRHFPESAFETETLCHAAVINNGWELRYVPESLKTEVVCLAAVSNRGEALQFVPESLKTEALCHAAIRNDGWALQYCSAD